MHNMQVVCEESGHSRMKPYHSKSDIGVKPKKNDSHFRDD